jgi:hypothetical protein
MPMFSPPVLSVAAPMSTPSTSSSACARLLKRFCSSSLRVMTVMEAGASLMSCSKPEAETTTSRSSATGSAALCADAAPMAHRAETATDRGRRRCGQTPRGVRVGMENTPGTKKRGSRAMRAEMFCYARRKMQGKIV